MNPASMGGGSSSQDDLMLDYLLEMGALSPQQADLARQRQMIEGLRGSPQAQIPTDVRSTGRIQQARHPGEMIAPLLHQGAAMYREGKADTAEGAYKKARLGAFDRLRSKKSALGGGDAASMFAARPMPGEDTQPLG